MILLEHTAGQGTNLGHRFEHLQQILEYLDGSPRVGVCLDTCHLLAAGYDLCSEQGYASTFAELDRLLGLDRVRVFHLNDSKKPCGSRVDRHEHIGKGCLGLEPFRRLLNDPRFAALPMLLETPKLDTPESRRRERRGSVGPAQPAHAEATAAPASALSRSDRRQRYSGGMRKVTGGLIVALILAAPRPIAAWGFEGHKYIMEAAIPLLPAEIRPFFVANRISIVEHAIDPDLWRTAGCEQETPHHFIDMDAYGPYPFTSLPHVQSEAVGQVRPRDGGQERHAALARRGDLREARRGIHPEVGVLARQHQVLLVGDCSLRRRRARAVPCLPESRWPTHGAVQASTRDSRPSSSDDIARSWS